MARERIFLIFAVIVLFIISACILVQATVLINEFEQNPEGTDAGNEWLELYNTASEDVNLTGRNLVNGDNQLITLNTTIQAYSYLIINFSGQWLDNSDENITIKNGTDIIDITLTASDNDNNALSWSRCPNGYDTNSNSDWNFVGASLGTANNCTTEQNQTQQNQTQTQNSSTNETQPPASSNPITQSQSTESSLSIIDAPSKASFGETIDVDITAYRGDTAKYAVYLYIKKDEDIVSEKVSLHLDDKLKSYSFTVPLRINPNCDAGYDEGTYDIILEGLDKLALKEVTLKGNAECESEVPKRGKVSYKIDFPDEVQIGKEFIVSVKIYNNQNKRQQFSVWSYVYQDNKCLSCGNKTREANAEQAIIYEYESATVFLKNSVYSTDEGVYKLKVKVLQEGYETTKDFTFDIFVKRIPAEENKASSEATAESILNSEPLANESSEQSKITGKVVYKADKKSPLTTLLLFTVLCLLLLLYFMLKKKPAHNEKREGKKTDTKKEAEAIEEEILKDEDFGGEEPTESTGLGSKEDKTEKSFSDSETETESEKQENGV